MTASRWVGAALVAALGAAGCGYNPPDEGVVPTVAPPVTSAATTTTMLPAGGRQPTAEDPLRVVFAGDSVMAELAPPASDALNRGGSTEAKFVLSPGVSLDAAGGVLWRQQLETFDPEVIVVLVGTWETGGTLGVPGAPGWRARYDTEILEPFVDLVTSGGAELVWVGMPAVAEDESTFLLAELNAAYADLPARFDGVTYIAGGEYLSAPTGGYAEFLDGVDGPERVRRIDGLHLCPDGAVRLAEPVVGQIEERWNVPIADDWRSGDWRRPPILVKPEECPPV
jgi:hypothetical protein